MLHFKPQLNLCLDPRQMMHNSSFNELTGTLPAEWDDFVGLFAE